MDPALYDNDNVTSSLKGMHSLKRFVVFIESLEFSLMRSLLLGALCNRNTTEVFISERYVLKSFGKCIQNCLMPVNIIYHFC